jgi:murein DD-endopeptidase MepM/ murein hydrolase activator NlpD
VLVYQARSQWLTSGGAGLVPAPAPIREPFGRKQRGWRDIDLTVDLGRDVFSKTWWRGLGTLGALCLAAALLAPNFTPLPGGRAEPLGDAEYGQMKAIGVTPLANGAKSGMRMAETDLVEPLSSAPERPTVDLFAKLGQNDSMLLLLGRSGVAGADAQQAAALVAAAAPGGIAPDTSVAITLGRRIIGGSRPIERLSLRASLDLKIAILRDGSGLKLERIPIAVDSTPLRLRGRAGDGLYFALRAAGVSPQSAGEYLRALATQIDVGSEVGPDDRFDLVVANRHAATGENQPGPLLYAGLDRVGASDMQLLKWTVAGRTEWFEASGVGRQTAGMMWPVRGPITSTFGLRYHPILHFARMHKGVDFGAHWGAPIVAAADGQVVGAGWAGGYGQQVRLAHAGGISTSYSHMSRIAIAPGSMVRQGQLIGYVGSSGLSTGPHLHYEVYRGGSAVNPLSVRFVTRSTLEGAELEAFRARLRSYLSIGMKG